MMEISMGLRRPPKVVMPALPPHSQHKVRSKRKYEEWHPDGSGRVMWITDTDISDGESNKENYCVKFKSPRFHRNQVPRAANTLSPLSTSTTPSPSKAFQSTDMEGILPTAPETPKMSTLAT